MEKIASNVEKVEELLEKLEKCSGENALKEVATFLKYQLIKNPIDLSSEWYLLSHPELDDDTQALMALKFEDDLTQESNVKQLRKKYDLVEVQKEKFRGFNVYLYAFVGNGRILIFKGYDSNRDERIDISKTSIRKVTLFADNFIQLSVDNIAIEEDDFGFGKEVVGLEKLFKRELTNLFMLTVQLYRKQIAEMITTNKTLENKIMKLLPEHEQKILNRQKLKDKLLNPNFKVAIGSVIDTIVLRVVLRRFLESYHGFDPFTKQDDFKDLGLGQREGKMQEVINYLAEIEYKNITEREIQSVIDSGESGQIAWDLFEEVTQGVVLKETLVSFMEIHDRLRKQFEIAYGGDLFSSDISDVVNQVEKEINLIKPELLLHLLVDTSEERFNFRYEDLPPEMIQDFYESSMGFSLHYSINEDGKSTVTYSDDLQEKKHRGAYYTKQELVDYMVAKTVGSVLDVYLSDLSNTIKIQDKNSIFEALKNISSLSVIDITCGGGSFLRGAFRFLASKREGILRTLEKLDDISIRDEINKAYPFFENSLEAESLWERHVLLHMIYGIDIDYKALIISSQTLTLSALNNWQIGVNFPRLIGLTLIQQNSLISPVRVFERKKAFSAYKKEIKEMIKLRKDITEEKNTILVEKLCLKLEEIRVALHEKLNKKLSAIINNEYKEALMPQSIEVNFPEIFFGPDGEVKENGGFSVSIGNPPWEIWKPNAEEFFEVYNNEFRNANREDKESIKEEIFFRNPALQEKWEWMQGYYEAGSNYFLQNGYYDFQRVKVDGRYTGGDINLYKLATERNYQILAQNGKCGYLVPSGIYTDRGSTGLRNMLFERTELVEIASFENRKNIFANVDGRYKFAVVLFNKGGKTDVFRAFFYKLSLDALHNSDNFLHIPIKLVKELSPGTSSIMEYREQVEVDLMNKLIDFPSLGDSMKDKWNLKFTREFDLTNDSSLFNEKKEGYNLYVGKTINQFSDTGPIHLWINEEEAKKAYYNKEKSRIKKLDNKIKVTQHHASSDYFRFGCRAIARSNDKRSLISTIIPKNVACGNSILVSQPYEIEIEEGEIKRFPNYSVLELTVITGLMNSFIVDFVLRRKISANVNMFYLYQLPVPRLTEENDYFTEIAKRVAMLVCTTPDYEEIKREIGIESGVKDTEIRQKIVNQIDAYVGKIYGLTREEFIYVLSTFKSVNHAEEMQDIAQGVIEQFDILGERGTLECPTIV